MAKIIVRDNENLEFALKRFKKAVKNEHIMEELQKRSAYMSPSVKAKEKSKAAQKRIKKFKR